MRKNRLSSFVSEIGLIGLFAHENELLGYNIMPKYQENRRCTRCTDLFIKCMNCEQVIKNSGFLLYIIQLLDNIGFIITFACYDGFSTYGHLQLWSE